MRLSTNTIYAMGTQSILDQQARVTKVGQQLSTGQRINTPADDPGGAAQLLDLKQASQINEQYASVRSTARNQLGAEENQLNTAVDALESAKQALVGAANGTLSDGDRTAYANKLQGVYDEILSAANAKDSQGDYIFGGFDTDTAPFSGDAGNQNYGGDQGQRMVQVDGSRRIAVNDSGSEVFASTTASARYIATAGDNQGSTTYRSLEVTSAEAEDYGNTFELTFNGSGDEATYSVVNRTTGETVVDNAAYESGESIALGDSLSTRIQGQPADGDSYTFGKGRSEDSNILDALSQAIDVLRQPLDSENGQARLTNTVNRANRQVDNSLDNILSVRSNLGSRINTLDKLDETGESQSVNYERNISDVRDVDLYSTISEFSLSQVALQAAQQSFMRIQQSSMFSQ